MKKENKKILKALAVILIIAGSLVGTYFLICFLWNTDSPITVVEGESMEPTLYQGDLLFVLKPRDLGDIQNGSHSERTGDILIYYSPIKHFLIVHRVIDKKFESGIWYFSTQGDHNSYTDNDVLYDDWLSEENVKGIMIGRIPWIGNIGIFLRDSGIGIFLIIIILAYIIISTIFENKSKESTATSEEKTEKVNLFSTGNWTTLYQLTLNLKQLLPINK